VHKTTGNHAGYIEPGTWGI